MKKLLFPLLVTLLFAACKKETSPTLVSEEIIGAAAASKSGKIDVCHYDAKTRKSQLINISANAWPAHKAHGDVLGACVETTTICDQVWMVKNLDVSTYGNGDPIPQVTDPYVWSTLSTGAWCYFNNDPANGPIYGKLYNWYAVNDPRGLAPAGWHVPLDAEWTKLYNCLYAIPPIGNVGDKIKEAGTAHWAAPNDAKTNISGFTALPAGFRDSGGPFNYPIGYWAFWWSSSEDGIDFAPLRFMYYGNGDLLSSSFGKQVGMSVRCVRD